jgi:hypothetical protein
VRGEQVDRVNQVIELTKRHLLVILPAQPLGPIQGTPLAGLYYTTTIGQPKEEEFNQTKLALASTLFVFALLESRVYLNFGIVV